MATGAALFLTMPDCQGPAAGPSSCSDNRLRSALAGGLVGAGLVSSVVGATFTIARFRTPSGTSGGTASVTAVALSLPF